jgi:hypothetical protein
MAARDSAIRTRPKAFPPRAAENSQAIEVAAISRAALGRGDVSGQDDVFEGVPPSRVPRKDDETKAPACGRGFSAGWSSGWMGTTAGLRKMPSLDFHGPELT